MYILSSRKENCSLILGPNEVGKTTLLKCINAIHRPSRGTVMVADRNILKMKPEEIALGIGYVSHNNESAKLTVFDAVLMGRKPHIRWRVSDHDLKVIDSDIHRLHMDSLSLKNLDQLNGGELQKVAIARAMVQEPWLMLLDESTSSLDLKSRIEILNMLKRVVTELWVGAVMSMHDLNTAMRYAEKVLFLKRGSIHSTVSKT